MGSLCTTLTATLGLVSRPSPRPSTAPKVLPSAFHLIASRSGLTGIDPPCRILVRLVTAPFSSVVFLPTLLRPSDGPCKSPTFILSAADYALCWHILLQKEGEVMLWVGRRAGQLLVGE